MKQIMYVSFSGGKTSAYMARRLLDEHADKYDLRFMFSNTGQEHEKTLEFVDKCDREWGLSLVWLEAEVVQEKRKGTGYRVVSFETASRDGRPFEDVIRKYGIPNKAFPHCTRELKAQPMKAWMRDDSKCAEYVCAIGLRADEMDRVNPDFKKAGLSYPLIGWGIRKYDVLAFWDKHPFTLDIPEHQGNCLWCWKKSGRKHGRLVREMPWIYDFPARMEKQYGSVNSDRPKVFFRDNTSTEMLLRGEIKDFDLDDPNGCSESCQVFDFE